MIEFGILLIGFFATLIAIKGETWNKDSKGFRKITLTGYITGILAFIAIVLGGLKNYTDKKDSMEKTLLLENVSENTNVMKDSISSLKNILDSSELTIMRLKTKIDAYEVTLNKISNESERQPQWTFLNYYTLRSNQSISMPNRIFSGSLLKFVGECYGCELVYGDHRIHIPPFSYSSSLEIPIVGASGSSYNWYIIGSDYIRYGDCEFKIYILSTPRSRSSKWSYEE
jgi:hypothetical protein